MKNILSFLAFLILGLNSLKAQFLWAEVGVDGLTCSACSRSVEMSIVKLNFVDSVVMNLEHTEGKIYFKKNTKVEMDKIAQAVVDAGFSVRFLKAAFLFNAGSVFFAPSVSGKNQFVYENTIYQFLKPLDKTLSGETTITFIGKKFLSKKEFAHWKNELKNDAPPQKEKIYFITL